MNKFNINNYTRKHCSQISIKNLYIRLVFTLFIILVSQKNFAVTPNILLDLDELNAIKAKVVANIEPWKSGYNKLIIQANSALSLPDMSVTFGGLNQCGSNNIFCTEPYYGASSDRYDWLNGAKPLGIGVRDLGMAYAFTGDSQYADKLIQLVKVWSINPSTAMQPVFGNSQGRMDLYGTMTGMIYGVGFVWDYSGWSQSDKDTFKNWVRTLAYNAKAFGPSPNNFENWRNALLSISGAFLDDQVLLDAAFQNYRNAIPSQVHWTGRMNWEYDRTNGWGGLGYSLYAIHAMTITAEVARHRGVDLYNYTSDGVRGLKVALDYHVPFAINPSSWPWGIGTSTINGSSGVGIYEVAYSYWQDSNYLDVINQWGRPMTMGMWAFGVITLTHANQFDLVITPQPPSILMQPESVTVQEGESAIFNVNAIGDNPLSYQWYRDNGILSGETNNTLMIEQAGENDDGAIFHCEIANSLGSEVSNDVVLTVVMDTIAPTVDSGIVLNSNQVDIRFSEAVTPASAQSINNYQIDQGITISSATLDADGKTVHLQTDNLQLDTVYTVTISNIEDISAANNPIAPQSSVEIIFSPVITFDNGLLPLNWIPLTASRWSVVADNGNNALFLNTTDYSPLSGSRLGEHIVSPDSYTDFSFTVNARTNESSGNTNADYTMLFGYQNGDNYYYMLFNRTQSNTQLFKVVNGVRELLATASNNWLLDDVYHVIETQRTSNNIEIRFDNNTVLQVTDSTFLSGQVGLGSYNDSAYFDDIRISSANIVVTDVIFSNGFE